jgi:hypothetical protein
LREIASIHFNRSTRVYRRASCPVSSSLVLMAGLLHPLRGRSDRTRCRIQPSAGGRSDWLSLLRRTLSFPIPIRFIPAHPDRFSLPDGTRIPPFWTSRRSATRDTPLRCAARVAAFTSRFIRTVAPGCLRLDRRSLTLVRATRAFGVEPKMPPACPEECHAGPSAKLPGMTFPVACRP